MKTILILGIGNILQSDDGIGVHIANYISQNVKLPDNTEVIDGGTSGFDLIPVMRDRKKIIIIDALKTLDNPGSVYRFKPDMLKSSYSGFSLHDIGIIEVIKMLKILGGTPEIEIIGIVPEDINTLDIHISPSVKEAIPKAVEQILDAAKN